MERRIQCGINTDPANPQGNPSVAQLQELGATWVRFTFKDNHPGPEPAAFHLYDTTIQQLHQAGIRILLILTNETLPGRPPRDADLGQWQAYIQRFAERSARIAQHYGEQVAAYQIWNEPDIHWHGSGFNPPDPGYDPQLPPQIFSRFLQACRPAIGQVSRATIVAAGLAAGQASYLRATLDAGGGQLAADVVAIHPYGRRPSQEWPPNNWGGLGVIDDLLAHYRQVLPLPIWITETGTQSQDVQGEFPGRMLEAINARSAASAPAVFWFCWSDGMVDGFGLVDRFGSPKAGHTSYRRFARLPAAPPEDIVAADALIDRPSLHHGQRQGQAVRYIIVHSTQSPVGTPAEQVVESRVANQAQTSVHELVMPGPQVYRMVADERAARHCGAATTQLPDGTPFQLADAVTWAIEAYQVQGRAVGRQVLERTVERIAAACHRFGLQAERVLGHGEIDPQRQPEPDGVAMAELRAAVAAQLVEGQILAAAEQRQAIRFNTEAALQKRIFADGYVPNSDEFDVELEGARYTGQRAEHLQSGDVRIYYLRPPHWADVRFAEPTRGIATAGEELLALFRRAPTLSTAATRDLLTKEEPMQEPALPISELGSDDAAAPRSSGLSPEMLDELRPFVVNLTQGRFSTNGEFSSSPEDVDTLFAEHLERAVEKADLQGEKLHLLFYAHGGLVSESNALRQAYQLFPWWLQNGVYPIYFVWETGLAETLRQLLTNSQRSLQRTAARDIWDITTDPLIEMAARALYGPVVWSGMKYSAERAAAAAGGAHYVAQRLKAFCDRHGERLALHAVGHSAGSIFHSHFVPTALDLGVPAFRSVHFLAPAVRVDTFRDQLGKRMGAGVDHLSIFTMRKSLEEADSCVNIYRKSLLYLVSNALEPERRAPLLGLEASLRADANMRQLFGLSGRTSSVGEVIWSTSPTSSGRSASQARSHGWFDNDPPTMNSVVRRVLGKADHEPVVDFGSGGRGLFSWLGQVDWPDALKFLVGGGKPQPPALPPPVQPPATQPPIQPPVVQPPVTPPPPPPTGSGGRRLALCIGINRYPTAPLAGCVADARLWAQTLMDLGFEQPAMLLDEQATRHAIMDQLSTLIGSSRPGDVVVFQYAGHGTQVPDVSGDEAGGDSPGKDEALCPYDFAEGGFVIDDDIGEIFDQIPQGVDVTCFIDCCHSGTITRFAIGGPAAAMRGRDERPRFLVPTPATMEAHLRFRRRTPARRSLMPRGPENMREVLFSACLSTEVAWESNGQGEFTVRAIKVLTSGQDGLTNEEFQRQVLTAFGQTPRQHPALDCAPQMRGQPLLRLAAPTVGGRGAVPAAAGRAPETARVLRAVAAALESGD